MKCLLIIILLITLITHSFQLLKRSVKAETKTETQIIKENTEVKTSLTNLNSNNINVNDVKITNPLKEKVYIKNIYYKEKYD